MCLFVIVDNEGGISNLFSGDMIQVKSGFLKNYKLFSTNLPYISLLQKQYNVVFQNGFRFLIPQVPKRILKYFPLLKTSKVSESGIWL